MSINSTLIINYLWRLVEMIDIWRRPPPRACESLNFSDAERSAGSEPGGFSRRQSSPLRRAGGQAWTDELPSTALNRTRCRRGVAVQSGRRRRPFPGPAETHCIHRRQLEGISHVYPGRVSYGLANGRRGRSTERPVGRTGLQIPVLAYGLSDRIVRESPD